MNKQLKLLRALPANTKTSVPLENVTNLLLTNAEMEDSSKSKKKPASANPSGIRRLSSRCQWEQNSTRERK
jgi:hypothetical protein